MLAILGRVENGVGRKELGECVERVGVLEEAL